MKRKNVPTVSGDPISHGQSSPEGKISVAEMAGNAPEVDLHGLDLNEARAVLERFIDVEYLSGSEVIHIVHGNGTGALRESVRRTLEKDERVVFHRPGVAAMGASVYAVLKK